MTPLAEGSPHDVTLTARIAAQTAATPVAGTVVAEAQEDATLTAATFSPDAAIVGATATKRTFTIVNRGQDGTGNTVMATLDFITGTNAAAADEVAFTLSVVAGARNVAAGDVIAVAEAVTSTGTANPGGLVKVTLSRR